MLRFLETSDRWFVLCGKRGGLRAMDYPQSLREYKGKSWCGINIE